MKPNTFFLLAAIMPFVMNPTPNAWGETAAAPGHPLANLSAADTIPRFTPSSGSEDQVSAALSTDAAAHGVVVTIQPGKAGYPGMTLKPEGAEGAVWDLSTYGHIEARVVNTGTKSLGLTMRVDNKGDWHDSPWNTEMTNIKPGATATLKVVFGYSFGKKGYPLKPAEIIGVLFFCGKSKEAQSFRIESIEAGGPVGEQPPVIPGNVRTKPPGGVILGTGAKIDAASQIAAKGDAQASLASDGKSLQINFSNGAGQSVTVKPTIGAWDLREAFQVRAKVKNTGASPVTPTFRVDSKAGPTSTGTASAPIAPGATGELVVTFEASAPWLGIKDSAKTSYNGQPGTGTKFTSDAVSAVNILPGSPAGAQSLQVESIIADVPAPTVLPDWVGKRPPVEGDWVKTFDEEFDGNKLDETKWNIYADNFWDKRSHFTKDNVILGDGVVKLRYEKKTGFHNDDPAKKQTDYATGFLDTYGKWVQRYGYFESRMKATKGPGMWPAFWLMPDRGVAEGPQWKRASTSNGGMEFDIWEFLGRWGQYRYNIAMHWDGYGKDHQSTGTTTNYVMPDKDGFITIGFLWTPGQAVYYANGKEVLRWESPRISTIPADIMFTAVSGGWDNDGIDPAKMPDDYVIDYVRCWQRKDLASPADGPKSPAAAAAK